MTNEGLETYFPNLNSLVYTIESIAEMKEMCGFTVLCFWGRVLVK